METWCDACQEVIAVPHDCPFNGNIQRPAAVRLPVTPVRTKAKWRVSKWHLLWIGPLAYFGGRYLYDLCFLFWAWLDK